MRTDCRIDGQQIWCPNASTFGYGKTIARVGDWITYRMPDDDREFTGRMIGRVAWAPSLQADEAAWDGAAVVMVLGMDLTHGFERWVRPEWITHVHAAAPDIARFLSWFASADIRRMGADYLRVAMEYGAVSANQEPTEPTWDHAHKMQRFDEYRQRATRQ